MTWHTANLVTNVSFNLSWEHYCTKKPTLLTKSKMLENSGWNILIQLRNKSCCSSDFKMFRFSLTNYKNMLFTALLLVMSNFSYLFYGNILLVLMQIVAPSHQLSFMSVNNVVKANKDISELVKTFKPLIQAKEDEIFEEIFFHHQIQFLLDGNIIRKKLRNLSNREIITKYYCNTDISNSIFWKLRVFDHFRLFWEKNGRKRKNRFSEEFEAVSYFTHFVNRTNQYHWNYWIKVNVDVGYIIVKLLVPFQDSNDLPSLIGYQRGATWMFLWDSNWVKSILH